MVVGEEGEEEEGGKGSRRVMVDAFARPVSARSSRSAVSVSSRASSISPIRRIVVGGQPRLSNTNGAAELTPAAISLLRRALEWRNEEGEGGAEGLERLVVGGDGEKEEDRAVRCVAMATRPEGWPMARHSASTAGLRPVRFWRLSADGKHLHLVWAKTSEALASLSRVKMAKVAGVAAEPSGSGAGPACRLLLVQDGGEDGDGGKRVVSLEVSEEQLGGAGLGIGGMGMAAAVAAGWQEAVQALLR